MDRKLQCDPSSTRQHLVYLLAVDIKTLPLDRVRDTPSCIYTLCIMRNSFEFLDGCSKPSLSSVRAPNRRLAWVRAAFFRPLPTAGSLKSRILYDLPPLLAIFKFARKQWQWKFSIIGFSVLLHRKCQSFLWSPRCFFAPLSFILPDDLVGMNSVSVDYSN